MSVSDPFALEVHPADPSVAEGLSAERLSALLVAARPASSVPAFEAALASLSRRDLVALVMTYLLAHPDLTPSGAGEMAPDEASPGA